MKRPPAFAGKFYPGSRPALERELEEFLDPSAEKIRALGAISPHAGYMYSGAVAGALYSSLKLPENIILLGPNHTGIGPDFSIMAEGEWEVPNGKLRVNAELARKLLPEIPALKEDITSHMFEHSLEVQLPFIAHLKPDASFVPIIIGRARLDDLRKAGDGLARAIKSFGRETLIITSSDMSHYEPEASAREKDSLAIGRITALAPEGLYNTVLAKNITMCGYLPAVMMLFALKELGAKEGRLIKYATSGEASGDFKQVVGYAGILIS